MDPESSAWESKEDKKYAQKRFMPDSQATPHKQAKKDFNWNKDYIQRKPSKGNKKKFEFGENLCLSKPHLYKDIIGVKHVAICNVEPMTPEQNNSIHKALIQEIAKMEKGTGPSFVEITYKDNCIAIVCTDQASRDWLVDTIPKIKPWPEAELSIMPDEQLPIQIASVYVAINVAETVEETLKLLQVQNCGINTDRWKVLMEKIKPKGRVITFSLDQESVEVLKVRGYRAAIGMTQVFFKFQADPH